MKAKKKSGSTKGKSSGKRAVKDLPAKDTALVKGGNPSTIGSATSGAGGGRITLK